jgi:hypothetical protein
MLRGRIRVQLGSCKGLLLSCSSFQKERPLKL